MDLFTSLAYLVLCKLQQWVCSCFQICDFFYARSNGVETQHNIVHLLCRWAHVGMLDASVELSATIFEVNVFYTMKSYHLAVVFWVFKKH